jgi:hypothetical protein
MAEPEYRRLSRGRNRRRFAVVSTTRSSLWLGKDHLLVIDTSGYTETYKRFHFRDIQSLVLCRTDRWLYQAVILAALGCLFGLIAIVAGGPAAWIFGILAGIFGLCVVLDLVAGPTSKCYVRTAVQTEELAPLSRLGRARRVLATLRPLITSAQGELPREKAAEGIQTEEAPPVIKQDAGVPTGTVPSNPASETPA